MSADKHKIAANCWKKATEALSREQFDYAVDMFFRAMQLSPDNVLYRQSLRGAARKMYGDNGSGARMSSIKLMGTRGKIKKSRLTRDWKTVDALAEEGLKVNPWDAGLNATVGEACKNLGFSDVALFGYELALKADPESKEYNREYALLQEERGNYKEAISAWHRICKIDPDDNEARSKLTHLEASSMMKSGGYDDAQSTRDVKSAYDLDRKPRDRKQPEATGPGVSLEADLQRAIRKEPANKDNYLKLADLYRRDNRLEEAVEMLRKALELSGGDPAIREQCEDVELELLRHSHQLAKDALADDPQDATAKKNAVALGREVLLREIEVFSRRVERYPKDARLKFELARRHMQMAEHAKAIPLLQQAVADSRIEADVLVHLGDCFVQEKKPVLALRQYEKAKGLVNLHDNPDLFKRVYYMLGRLYEEAGKTAQADECYQEVLGVDYEYRDTLKRLENLQSGGD